MNRPSFRGGARGGPQTATTNTTSGKVHFSPDGADTDALINAKETEWESLVKPLEPPGSHHLNAAQGWLGLGDWQSALDELAFIDPVIQ